MADTPEKTNQAPTAQTSENGVSFSFLDSLKDKINQILRSWKVRLGLGLALLLGIFTLIFFWQHLVATLGMNMWSSRSGAEPIECMIKDTNDDHYISCSAIRDENVIPLECGANILNLGCRVNYGTAASPPIKTR